MKPSYDPAMYGILKEKCEVSIAMMHTLSASQHDAKKLPRIFKKGDVGYCEIRRIMSNNRMRLRKMNKDINRYYDFCDRYPELRRFGHI